MTLAIKKPGKHKKAKRPGHYPALTNAARGQLCTVQLFGICNYNRETTSAAHYKQEGQGGTGTKPPDTQVADCCSDCHNVLDGRAPSDFDANHLRSEHMAGVVATIDRRLSNMKLAKYHPELRAKKSEVLEWMEDLD